MSVVSGTPDAKPSKAWIWLLALAIAAILVLALCIAGVFYDVNKRVPDAIPSPSRSPSPSVVPTPSRSLPGSPFSSVDEPAVG
jgi:hypothetical protein